MRDTGDTSLLAQYTAPRAPDGRVFCRGTAVSLHGQGLLMIGPSGSGKTQLALEMMAFGADLVADDGVFLTEDARIERPKDAPRLIEARGVGLLTVAPRKSAPLSLIADLSRAEPDRLPPRRIAAAPGGPVPMIRGRDHPFLAAAICQYLKMGRAE